MTDQGSASVEPSTNVPVAQVEDDSSQTLKNTVAYETHKRLLDERKRDLQKLRELEAREKEREEADARKRGDYETLIKSREEALKAKETELSEIKQMITVASKKNAVVEALGNNLESKWLKFIDISDVGVNPETGEVDQFSVAKVADAFKKEFPEAFRKAGVLPSQAPQGLPGGDGKISREEWLKLSHKDMVKWKPHQIID